MRNKNPFKLIQLYSRQKFLLKITLVAMAVLVLGIGALWLIQNYPGKW